MQDRLEQIKQNFKKDIAGILTLESLEEIEKKYLGRKDGELTAILKILKNLSPEEKATIGKLANEIRQEIEGEISSTRKKIEHGANKFSVDFDITLPGKEVEQGHIHPINQFIEKLSNIFLSMGFEIIEGNEVENEEYNFDLLNIPADHPARDKWDTYFVKNREQKLLLRTHISPMQIRAMRDRQPPVRLVVPGRAFRHESVDASHETTFYQCECLVIDKNISLTDLVGTLKIVFQKIFDQDVKVRVRPSFFPFVEPGLEVDMSCLLCGGKGCPVCKHKGWVEMLGAGMVHPKVLENMGVDPNEYSGFAFGLGVDRLMMALYGVDDIRLIHKGDLRFNKQF
ncbi:MAG: phenylalanine--tRNA ligase subunit alpha [Patescibacteria group bacterium]